MSPILSSFRGIIVRLYDERNSNHHLPHIHAKYEEYNIAVGLDGEILEGDFPKRQLRMLLGWMAMYEDELYANWETYQECGEYFKIEPLR